MLDKKLQLRDGQTIAVLLGSCGYNCGYSTARCCGGEEWDR
jgi:hypothetical protein